MSWQTVLQESARIWLVNSWLTTLTYLIWVKTSSNIKLSKGKLIIIFLSLSITHAILKTIIPGIAFIFLILLFILISVASYKLTILKTLKSILKLMGIMLVSEVVLHVIAFKILVMQGNIDSDIILIISGVLNLLLVLIIKRKELLKMGFFIFGEPQTNTKKPEKPETATNTEK